MSDRLSVRFEHDGEEAVVLLEMTRVRMEPWVRRLAEIVAKVDDLSLDQSINRSLSSRDDGLAAFVPEDPFIGRSISECRDDLAIEPGDPAVILPASLWAIFEAGEEAPGSLTDSQIAAAVFDYAFDLRRETPWFDEEDVEKLPKTAEDARAQLKTWLGDAVPGEDELFWEGLEHALAARWTEMGKTVRKLLGVMGATSDSGRQAE